MIHSFVNAFLREEDGQDLVEYSLLLGFIALASVAILTTLKGQISTLFSKVGSKLASAN